MSNAAPQKEDKLVLVTGASGFLGRYVVASLPSLSGATIIPVSRTIVLPGGLMLRDYCECPKVDLLIHLAEEPDRIKVNREGESYLQRSSDIVKSLLACASGRLIYASSAVVYGDQGQQPFTTDAMVHGNDTYSKSKLINEKLVLDGGGCVVRLSNLVGLGMSLNNVVSDILAQVPQTGQLFVRDDTPVRDYLAVEDAARAIAMLAIEVPSEIVNVGSGLGTSVRQLAEMVLSIAGQNDRKILAATSSQRESFNVLDIDDTISMIGWRPLSTLHDILNQLIKNLYCLE